MQLSKSLAAFALLASALSAFAGTYQVRHYRVNNPGRWKVDAAYPVFTGAGPLGDFANRGVMIDLQHAKDFVKQSAEYQKDQPKPEEPYPYTSTVHVSMLRPDLIVVEFDTDEYLGGAHGMQTSRFYCFGYVNGQPKRLKIRDLFLPTVNARKTISNIIVAKLRKNKDAAWIEDGTVKEVDATQAEQFAITRTGLKYTFDPYIMGPYAVGAISVTVDFNEIRRALDPMGPLKMLLAPR